MPQSVLVKLRGSFEGLLDLGHLGLCLRRPLANNGPNEGLRDSGVELIFVEAEQGLEPQAVFVAVGRENVDGPTLLLSAGEGSVELRHRCDSLDARSLRLFLEGGLFARPDDVFEGAVLAVEDRGAFIEIDQAVQIGPVKAEVVEESAVLLEGVRVGRIIPGRLPIAEQEHEARFRVLLIDERAATRAIRGGVEHRRGGRERGFGRKGTWERGGGETDDRNSQPFSPTTNKYFHAKTYGDVRGLWKILESGGYSFQASPNPSPVFAPSISSRSNARASER